MTTEAPEAMFVAYKKVNALINAQDMVLGGPIVAALAIRMGSFDTLSPEQQVRLANTMTGQHAVRRIPQVADTDLGRRMNEEVFSGAARVVSMSRMQELWRGAHKDAFTIIAQGQTMMKELYGSGDAEEYLAFYLERQAAILLHNPLVLEAEAFYMEQISSEYGRRHMSDGYRMTQAARLKATLRPLLREILVTDEEIVAQFGERREEVVGRMIDISLPWKKRETTLTGLEVAP